MDEKKYGKAINEIHIFINKSSLHNTSKLQYSLIYNKLANNLTHFYNEIKRKFKEFFFNDTGQIIFFLKFFPPVQQTK